MAGNTNYATLATTTLANFADEIFDGVLGNLPVLYHMKEAGNIKISSGGTSFTHPIEHGTNTNFGAISKLGTIPTDIQDPYSRSEWSIKVVAGAVVVSIVDQAMNAGDKEKLIDLVQALKSNATNSVVEVLGTQFWQASPGTNDFNSIPQIISSTASTDTNALGGIDSSAATQTFWRPYVYATAVTAFNTSNAGLTAMDTARVGATFGKRGPTMIATTKAIYSLYQLALTPQVRYTQLDKGEAGFQNLLYATMPVYFDDDCTANRMFFIDTNGLRLQVLKEGNMRSTPFQQAYNQLVIRSILYLVGNLTCGSRRTQATIASITA